jgi:hypothetical protein
MRAFAMRFRGIMRSGDTDKLTTWIDDVLGSGIYAMQRFGKSLRQDLDAVRNAMTEPWSNGQAEGQINRLKTPKRAMCMAALASNSFELACCHSSSRLLTQFEDDPSISYKAND